MPFIRRNTHSNYLFWGLWEITEKEEDLWKSLPPSDEDHLLKSIKQDEKRIESLAARVALKELVEYHGYEYSGIEKNATGKPFLKDQELYISISHSHRRIAVCLSTKNEVGIDIQKINEKVRRVSDRVMSAEEIRQCENDLQQLTFVWCAKEALYKRYGKGKVDFKNDILVEKKEAYWEGNLINENSDTPIQMIESQIEDFILAIAI